MDQRGHDGTVMVNVQLLPARTRELTFMVVLSQASLVPQQLRYLIIAIGTSAGSGPQRYFICIIRCFAAHLLSFNHDNTSIFPSMSTKVKDMYVQRP